MLCAVPRSRKHFSYGPVEDRIPPLRSLICSTHSYPHSHSSSIVLSVPLTHNDLYILNQCNAQVVTEIAFSPTENKGIFAEFSPGLQRFVVGV